MGAVKYEQVYPGVDVVYYSNTRNLEYDFILAPGVEPSSIAMTFDGADAIEIDDVTGDLLLHTPAGTISQRRPRSYQDVMDHKAVVDSAYTVDSQGRVGFAIGPYDRDLPLVIDPILAYSSYLGGSAADRGHRVVTSANGNTYVAGLTTSVDFPGTAGTWYGLEDAFVTMLGPDGTVVFSTYLCGSDYDYANGIALDETGNVYVAGLTNSSNFPAVNAVQPVSGGRQDGFIAKLSADGSSLIYSTYLGGAGTNENVTAIAVDNIGNAYVVGETQGGFPVRNALFPIRCGGGRDGFVAKLASDGSSLVYSTYLCDTGFDRAFGIAADASGNAYVTGAAGAVNFPTTPGAYQTVLRGQADAYLTKLNPSGSALEYSTLLGGSAHDSATGNREQPRCKIEHCRRGAERHQREQ